MVLSKKPLTNKNNPKDDDNDASHDSSDLGKMEEGRPVICRQKFAQSFEYIIGVDVSGA